MSHFIRRPWTMVAIAIATMGSMFGGHAKTGGMQAGVFNAGGERANLDPSRPTPAAQKSNSQAKLRDLNFHRGGGKRRQTWRGVRCSVAQGKRNARKRRNVLRHRKHWKQARR
jgi:hypothetical protein